MANVSPVQMMTDRSTIQQAVREKYGAAALRVVQGTKGSGCCSGGATSSDD